MERIVTPGSRVLDIGVSDAGVADALAAAGVHRYLGLVTPGDQAFLDAVPARWAGRFHPMVSSEQTYRNDTDLLILREPLARAVWGIRDLSHVTHVAVERGAMASWVETQGALALSRLLGRVRRSGTYSCAGTRFDVFRAPGERRARPRRYLSEAVGVDGLLRRLEEEGLDYVILRWFERLPQLEPGEDLDMLVSDRDLPRLHAILAEEPGTVPVDIYSESGLEGADFNGMAYYPPRLAKQLLERAETHPSGARVPSPEDHLLSLAYHAVYHKGASSGLASDLVATETAPDHDYGAALTDVATSIGRRFPVGLEGADEALGEQGWRPPLDTLRRLSEQNPWVQRRFFPTADEQPAELPEPSAFFIRERALSVLAPDEILDVFRRLEFELLAVRRLSGPDRDRSVELVRGGNWGRGPFPVSGGEPTMLVVALHYGPRRPSQGLLARYPRLTNGDVLEVKMTMRDLVESRVGPTGAFNPVHSSDDEFETWEYLQTAVPEEVEGLREEVRRRRDNYRTTAPVLKVLSQGRRAKVEVVQGEAGPVVRKTFAPHARRHLDREIATMKDLAPKVVAVSPLLRSGPNWFETEFLVDALPQLPDRPDGRLVPLRVARAMVEILRQVHAQGVDLVDAKPQNFLLGRDGALRLVDFEFAHRYPGSPPDFERMYSFVGLPEDFADDVPVGELSYESRWQPFVGLPLDSLLRDPVWRQHLRRAATRAAGLTRTPVTLAGSGLRRGQRGLRSGRAWAGASYRRWARERARSAR